MAYAIIAPRQRGESFKAYQARQRANSAERQAVRDEQAASIKRQRRARRIKPEPETSDFDYSMNG